MRAVDTLTESGLQITMLSQRKEATFLVFEKNDRNETQIIRYSEDDFENREGDLLPGQLWLNGEIGGKRW